MSIDSPLVPPDSMMRISFTSLLASLAWPADSAASNTTEPAARILFMRSTPISLIFRLFFQLSACTAGSGRIAAAGILRDEPDVVRPPPEPDAGGGRVPLPVGRDHGDELPAVVQ